METMIETSHPSSSSWQRQQRSRVDDDATSDVGDMDVSDVMVDKGKGSRPRVVKQSDEGRRFMLECKELGLKHPEYDEKVAELERFHQLGGSLQTHDTIRGRRRLGDRLGGHPQRAQG